MSKKEEFEAMLEDLYDKSWFRYFSDITTQLERDLSCQIILLPTCRDGYKNSAVTLTRMICQTRSPKEAAFYFPQHIIIFDQTLPSVAAARLIAHDIYHVWIQRPENEKWDARVNRETGLIDYGEDDDGTNIEQKADKFSLRLLSEHAFRVGFTPPDSAKAFIDMLDDAMRCDDRKKDPAWPDHMTPEDAIEYIEGLYGAQASPHQDPVTILG